MRPGIEEALRASLAEAVAAGVLKALREPEARELLMGMVRAAVAEVVPQLKRPDQVAREYGIPESTQRYMRRTGRLKATKIGRTVLIDVSQFRPYSAGEIATLAAEARAVRR